MKSDGFPMKSDGFPKKSSWTGTAPAPPCGPVGVVFLWFSYGFPMVFLWSHMVFIWFSYGFPMKSEGFLMVFLWNPMVLRWNWDCPRPPPVGLWAWFSYGFPMVFLWFSYGFLMKWAKSFETCQLPWDLFFESGIFVFLGFSQRDLFDPGTRYNII